MTQIRDESAMLEKKIIRDFKINNNNNAQKIVRILRVETHFWM